MNEYIVSVILALIAAVPGLWSLVATRRKTRADAADIITEAAQRAVEMTSKTYEAKITSMRDEYTAKCSALLRKIEELYMQIAERDRVIVHMQGEINRTMARVKELEKKTGPIGNGAK